MKSKEAIKVIKANYPPENYTMLREALDLATRFLKEDSDTEEKTTQFKIGDYAINDGYGVVLPIRDKRSKDIINAQEGYRHATEDEIEGYYMEVEG